MLAQKFVPEPALPCGALGQGMTDGKAPSVNSPQISPSVSAVSSVVNARRPLPKGRAQGEEGGPKGGALGPSPQRKSAGGPSVT